MREDVVGVDDVRADRLVVQPAREPLAEKVHDGAHAVALGDGGDVGGRLDPEHRHPLAAVVLQQIAVVARDLDGEARRAQTARPDHLADQRVGMPQHRLGERRKVQVLAEHLLGRNGFRNLHQPAVAADGKFQRVYDFRLFQLLHSAQRIRERRMVWNACRQPRRCRQER